MSADLTVSSGWVGRQRISDSGKADHGSCDNRRQEFGPCENLLCLPYRLTSPPSPWIGVVASPLRRERGSGILSDARLACSAIGEDLGINIYPFAPDHHDGRHDNRPEEQTDDTENF